MPSVWIERRATKDGGVRYRVRYRLGGRESLPRYGGSFKRMEFAKIRRDFIVGELVGQRVPDVRLLDGEQPTAPTFAESAKRWHESRIDVAESTRLQHRIQLDKLLPLIGTRRIDTLTAQDFADVVVALHGQGVARETIRKTLGAGAMTLHHAGIEPNPARDRSVKLPPDDSEEVNPPSADHVETAFRLIPSKHRLALLFLDWSGARVSAIDKTLVGDYDEQRRRVRLRKQTTKKRRALWIDLHPVLAEQIEASLGPREDRDPEARLFASSGANALRTAIAKSCRAAGIPVWSPHDLRHRRISLLHLSGVPWARIAEFVGQRKLSVTADTYTHVLADETELDYAALLGESCVR
jgi:integrase